jgi:ectoine hydroxylase-related dioxygenase (phytanoyl-CoA dioxygenase family)
MTNAIQPVLDPGDVVIFDSWLYHKAGNNVSGTDRYGVNHVFTSPILKQQIDFPRLLNQEDIKNDKLKELLGFRFESAKSVNDFREKRYQKKSK